LLWDKQVTYFAKLIKERKIETNSGLNKKSSIARAVTLVGVPTLGLSLV
jgi:hypothetical protein